MAKLEINSENILPDLKPKENITLWRYMSFSSLCEILMNDHIPLISVSKFSDKSEGAILEAVLSKHSYSHEDGVEYAMKKYCESIFISSWHESVNENASMWERYTHGGEGVAIKTNAKLLLNNITNKIVNDIPVECGIPVEDDYLEKNVTVKRVKYIDNKPSDFEMKEHDIYDNLGQLCFFYKLDDFKDESEVRILTSLFQNPWIFAMRGQYHAPFLFPDALKLKIDRSDSLIQQIVVSPHAHNQFIQTIKQTIRHINFYRDSKQFALIDPDIVIESKRKDWV